MLWEPSRLSPGLKIGLRCPSMRKEKLPQCARLEQVVHQQEMLRKAAKGHMCSYTVTVGCMMLARC